MGKKIWECFDWRRMEKVPACECLYLRRKLQLLLSVFVDDTLMAWGSSGNSEDVGNIAKTSRFGRPSIIHWPGISWRYSATSTTQLQNCVFSKLMTTNTHVKISKKIPKTSQLGTTTWQVMLKSVLNALANWRIRRLTNFIRFPHLAWTITTHSQKIWELWENCQRLALKRCRNSCIWQELEDQNYFG